MGGQISMPQGSFSERRQEGVGQIEVHTDIQLNGKREFKERMQSKRQMNVRRYVKSPLVLKTWLKESDQFFNDREAKEVILYPLTAHLFEIPGTSSVIQQAELTFEAYQYAINKQISIRKEMGQIYSELQIWYLLYTFVRVALIFQSKNKKKIGNFHPSRVLINSYGHVKIVTLMTYPDQISNFEKVSQDRDTKDAFLAPQQFNKQDLNAGTYPTKIDPCKADVFSIGMTLLSIGCLQQCSDVYQKNPKYTISRRIIEDGVKILEKRYGKQLVKLIKGMLIIDPKFRYSCSQIYKILKKHKNDILGMRFFQIIQLENQVPKYDSQIKNQNNSQPKVVSKPAPLAELKVSDNIKIITSAKINYLGVEQITTKVVPLKELSDESQATVFDTLQKIEVIQQQNPKAAAIIYDEIVNKPPTKQEKQENDSIVKQFQKQLKQGKESQKTLIMMLLKGAVMKNNSDANVTFKKKCSVKSQVGLKALATGYFQDRVRLEHQYFKDGPSNWTFDKVKSSPQKFQEFSEDYKKQMEDKFGIPRDQMVIHKVSKVSVESSTDRENAEKTKKDPKIKPHPYFDNFTFSAEDFDLNQIMKFGQQRGNLMQRGGWPYFQPIRSTRYGLNVTKMYDNKNDDWLSMNGVRGQWAVGFHGMKSPQTSVSSSSRTRLDQFMSTKEFNTRGLGQVYEGQESVNKPHRKVGKGVYVTPHFEVALQSYTTPLQVGNSSYHLIFQCRVNPRKIKVTKKEEYWVINQAKHIRAYGIILVNASHKSQILKGTPQRFKYSQYKNKIEAFLAKS